MKKEKPQLIDTAQWMEDKGLMDELQEQERRFREDMAAPLSEADQRTRDKMRRVVAERVAQHQKEQHHKALVAAMNGFEQMRALFLSILQLGRCDHGELIDHLATLGAATAARYAEKCADVENNGSPF